MSLFPLLRAPAFARSTSRRAYLCETCEAHVLFIFRFCLDVDFCGVSRRYCRVAVAEVHNRKQRWRKMLDIVSIESCIERTRIHVYIFFIYITNCGQHFDSKDMSLSEVLFMTSNLILMLKKSFIFILSRPKELKSVLFVVLSWFPSDGGLSSAQCCRAIDSI